MSAVTHDKIAPTSKHTTLPGKIPQVKCTEQYGCSGQMTGRMTAGRLVHHAWCKFIIAVSVHSCVKRHTFKCDVGEEHTRAVPDQNNTLVLLKNDRQTLHCSRLSLHAACITALPMLQSEFPAFLGVHILVIDSRCCIEPEAGTCKYCSA